MYYLQIISLAIVATGALAMAQIKLPGKIADKIPGNNTASSVNTAPAASSGAPTVSGTINGQTVELTLTETVARNGNDVVATKPTKTFAYKGSVTNVFGTLKFTPPLQGAAGVKVTLMKNGSFADDRDITYQTGGRTGGFAFTLAPGNYDVQVSDKFDTSKVYLRDKLTVSPDTVGDRATGNVKAGSGTLTACKDVVDSKCVGESATWNRGSTITLLVSMPAPVGQPGQINSAWVIYKQKPNGQDGDFVDSVIQTIDGKWKKWWTADISFAPGVYTVYSVANQSNQSSEKSGNLKEYFAKMTLTVK